ncbi:MAG: hypothetical protein IJP90_13715 [Treponema sp.]|nr:hypothetical protein [Treponema sp.]
MNRISCEKSGGKNYGELHYRRNNFELSTNSEGKFISFKINGTAGYALQRKKDEKIEKYNVLSEKDNGLSAFIFKNDSKWECDEKFTPALTSAFTSNKRIRLNITKDENKTELKIEEQNFGAINSITLLSD